MFANRSDASTELDARERRELEWYRAFACKFSGPKNMPRPGHPLTRSYRLLEQLDDGSWREVVAR